MSNQMKFDRLGFSVAGESRVTMSGLFFHKTGYAIKINPLDSGYTKILITKDFLDNYTTISKFDL
jgi:hypothetical protein